MPQTFVIGDVHGCVDELSDLLREAGVGKDDRVLQVGDLLAKGPDSRGVLALCREWGIQAVLGNHDGHVLRARTTVAVQPPQGEHEQLAAALSADDWAYLEAMPLWRALPELSTLVVHAGLVPGVPLEQQRREDLLTMRSLTADGRASKKIGDGDPWASRWPGPQLVVFGHDAVRGLQEHPFALGLDTGCVYGRALTGVLLPERRLLFVKARRVYAEPKSRDEPPPTA